MPPPPPPRRRRPDGGDRHQRFNRERCAEACGGDRPPSDGNETDGERREEGRTLQRRCEVPEDVGRQQRRAASRRQLRLLRPPPRLARFRRVVVRVAGMVTASLPGCRQVGPVRGLGSIAEVADLPRHCGGIEALRMLDPDRPRGHRDGDILHARQSPDRCVHLVAAGRAVHARNSEAALVRHRAHGALLASFSGEAYLL